MVPSAVSAALPGDSILLADGAYCSLSVSKSGQSGKPIVIRAANILKAKFSGSITVNGSFVWIVGMDMGKNGIVINGKNVRVTRNYFYGSTTRAINATSQSRNVEIDHNEHGGGVLRKEVENNPIYMRYQCTEPSNHHVHHNYIHGATGGNGTSAIMSGFGLICSNGAPRDGGRAGTIIEYNLISNYKAGYCLRTKSGFNIFRFNTAIGCGSIQNRIGENNSWIANWFEVSESVKFFDGNHKIIGNRFIGGPAWLASGTLSYGEKKPDGATLWVASDNALVAGNIGNIIIGAFWSDGPKATRPTKNVRVEAHVTGNSCGSGNIICKLHQGTTFKTTTNQTVPKAFKLQPGEVGPMAPTAPR